MVVNSEFTKIPTTRELYNSLRHAKSEWALKTPMEKWCYAYGIGRAAYGFLRVSLMNDLSRTHLYGYFMCVYVFGETALSLYTVFYYILKGNLQMGLPSTCAAFVFIGHMPMVCIILFGARFKLQSLIDFGGRYIYHDNHEKTEYNRICSEHMDNTIKMYIRKMLGTNLSFIISIAEPVYAFIFKGIHSTTIEAHIPYTDPQSDEEFTGNFIIQAIIGLHGFFTYFGLELFLSLMENAVTITPRLVKCDLEDMIHQYEKKTITDAQLHYKIGNIVKQSTDADNYIGSISKLFFWRNLFTTTSFTYMIGMAIFCRYTMGFIAGYGLATMSWIQLYYVCEFGENIQDNGFAEVLYESNWEVLPTYMQKAIMLLIHRKQNEPGLRLGPFGMGVNRETFKLSTNKIYTLVMFLRSFFE